MSGLESRGTRGNRCSPTTRPGEATDEFDAFFQGLHDGAGGGDSISLPQEEVEARLSALMDELNLVQ